MSALCSESLIVCLTTSLYREWRDIIYDRTELHNLRFAVDTGKLSIEIKYYRSSWKCWWKFCCSLVSCKLPNQVSICVFVYISTIYLLYIYYISTIYLLYIYYIYLTKTLSETNWTPLRIRRHKHRCILFLNALID